ncbi:hypothetical protein LZ32DRAFT_606526, partial [Colletotrichum eremochloae]
MRYCTLINGLSLFLSLPSHAGIERDNVPKRVGPPSPTWPGPDQGSSGRWQITSISRKEVEEKQKEKGKGE